MSELTSSNAVVSVSAAQRRALEALAEAGAWMVYDRSCSYFVLVKTEGRERRIATVGVPTFDVLRRLRLADRVVGEHAYKISALGLSVVACQPPKGGSET